MGLRRSGRLELADSATGLSGHRSRRPMDRTRRAVAASPALPRRSAAPASALPSWTRCWTSPRRRPSTSSIEWFVTVASAGWRARHADCAALCHGRSRGRRHQDRWRDQRLYCRHSVPTSVAWGNDQTKCGWVVGGGPRSTTGRQLDRQDRIPLHGSRQLLEQPCVLATSSPQLRFDYTSKVTDVVLRAGVNYHFGGPVVAKY